MTSDDLTKSQAKVISDALYPGVNYLARLRTKMEKSGFSSKDKLFQLVEKAYDACNHLANEVHYMTCDGVGKPDRPD